MVKIFDDRVESHKPGGLPKGLSPEEFGKRSGCRNSLITGLLLRCDYIAKVGTGIERIHGALEREKCPAVNICFNTMFTLKFPRPTFEKDSESRKQTMVKTRVKILRLITENPEITKAQLAEAIGERLKDEFGLFRRKGQSQLVFSKARVLCKFSSFDDDQSRWFWGVSKIYWENWESTDYLALIMENEDRNGYSFVILDSDEAMVLFNVCSESNGEKKINMRIYADDNVVQFQEWKEYDVETHSQPLDLT